VQCGLIAATNVSSGSYADVSVTFPKAFYAAPIVVVSFETESTAGSFGRCAVAVTGAVTATGFTARIYNGDTTDRVPRVSWIAAGTPK
jgi:hypothetical protein